MRTLLPIAFAFAVLARVAVCAAPPATVSFPVLPATAGFPLPTVDLSADTARQVVVERGTPEVYQGHPTTVLLPDGKTLYCVWTIDHGGECGLLKRSDDGGRTWSALLDVPASWRETRNCPTLHRLVAPDGRARLFVFANKNSRWIDGRRASHEIWGSYSEDDGKTWSAMQATGLADAVMPFCAIRPVDNGRRLLAMTNLRREGMGIEKRSNIIAQTFSSDGGFTWSPWEVVLAPPELNVCEPELVRSPDGRQLLCLIRENDRRVSLYMTSDDEGKTWSLPNPLPPGLHGDRHMAKYLPDGRLVICFRDTGKDSPTRNHFVAWIGRYQDMVQGKDGDGYRVKLLHSYKGGDCGYPGVEVLPDGTVVATTYIKYREGPEKNSVVSTRFRTFETDALARRARGLR